VAQPKKFSFQFRRCGLLFRIVKEKCMYNRANNGFRVDNMINGNLLTKKLRVSNVNKGSINRLGKNGRKIPNGLFRIC